jgi:hypothetical protein
MKIGFSFGRCVRSIVKGEVNIDDVLCIIARTYMPNEQDVEWVVDEYLTRRAYLLGLDRDRCHEVGLTLWKTGRIIEPRQNGIHVMSAPDDCVWMDLYPTVVGTENASVKAAWDAYRMLINLVEQVPEPNENHLKSRDKDAAYDAANAVPRTEEEKAQLQAAANLLSNFI